MLYSQTFMYTHKYIESRINIKSIAKKVTIVVLKSDHYPHHNNLHSFYVYLYIYFVAIFYWTILVLVAIPVLWADFVSWLFALRNVISWFSLWLLNWVFFSFWLLSCRLCNNFFGLCKCLLFDFVGRKKPCRMAYAAISSHHKMLWGQDLLCAWKKSRETKSQTKNMTFHSQVQDVFLF